MGGANGTNGYDENEGYITLPGGAIYGWTKQYDLFEFDPSNREIDLKNVEEKRKMIREGKDYLRECPAIVEDVHGRFIVRDGQHRKEAARLEGVVFYYILSDRVTAEDVIEINNSQHGWDAYDRIRHFVVQGRPEYKMLQAYMEKYPWITISVAVSLCHYGDRAKMGFADGTYTANDLDFAEEVAQLCLRLKPYASFYRETAFIGSIAACLELEGFSADRLVDKVSRQTGDVKRHGRIINYMEMWDQIYNKWQKEEDKLKIEKINSASRLRRADRKAKNRRMKEGK